MRTREVRLSRLAETEPSILEAKLHATSFPSRGTALRARGAVQQATAALQWETLGFGQDGYSYRAVSIVPRSA